LRRCLLSLSQKLTTPSLPHVANVPQGLWKQMALTEYTLLSYQICGAKGKRLGERRCVPRPHKHGTNDPSTNDTKKQNAPAGGT
jgi:hypothetical protein